MNALTSNYFEKTRMTKIEQKITFCHYCRSSEKLKGVEYVRRTVPSDITGLQEEHKVTHVEKNNSQTESIHLQVLNLKTILKMDH